jgi:hypothetical protein
LAASVAALGDVSVETAILVIDMAVAIFGMAAGFLLGWEVTRGHVGALMTATVFSLTPEFVVSLTWQMPTRIVFTALVPLFVWALLRSQRERGWRYPFVLALVVLLMMSFHRLTVLMAIVVVAFALAMIALVLFRILTVRYPKWFLAPRYRAWFPYLTLVAFFGAIAFILFQSGVLDAYSKGQFRTGDDATTQFINLSISLARSSGILLPLAFVGIVAFSRRRLKGFQEAFLLFAILLLFPTLVLRQYTGYYTTPFTSLFIAIGILALVGRANRKRLRAALWAILLVVLLLSTQTIVSYDIRAVTYMTEQEYATALYISELPEGTALFNDGLLGARLYAVVGRAYLPVGGATTPFQSPELLIFGFVTPEELFIEQIPLTELTIESDSPFVVRNVQSEADWVQLMGSDVGDIPLRLRIIYDPRYLIEDKALYGSFYAYRNVYASPLSLSIHASRYKTFENEGIVAWLL